MHVAHAYPIVTRMAESRPEEAVLASRYNFRVVTTGQGFVSVSEHPTCMLRGPGEQGLGAWHGRNGQHAVKYLGATELERAASFVRAMALELEEGPDVLTRYSPKRSPAAAGVRKVRKLGDKWRRENKPEFPVCGAEVRKASKTRKQWAAGIASEAASTVGAHLKGQTDKSV